MLPIMLEGENHEKQRRQMIKDALEWKSPELYQRLEKEKSLNQFAKDLENQMMSVFREEESKLLDEFVREKKNEDPNPIVRVQKFEMSIKRIWEETLETFLDFSDQTI